MYHNLDIVSNQWCLKLKALLTPAIFVRPQRGLFMNFKAKIIMLFEILKHATTLQ